MECGNEILCNLYYIAASIYDAVGTHLTTPKQFLGVSTLNSVLLLALSAALDTAYHPSYLKFTLHWTAGMPLLWFSFYCIGIPFLSPQHLNVDILRLSP